MNVDSEWILWLDQKFFFNGNSQRTYFKTMRVAGVMFCTHIVGSKIIRTFEVNDDVKINAANYSKFLDNIYF